MHTIGIPLLFGFMPQGFDFLWIATGALLLLGGPVLWILALISCVKNESSFGNTKVIWVIIIALSYVLGALAYLLVRSPQRIRELGR